MKIPSELEIPAIVFSLLTALLCGWGLIFLLLLPQH